MTDGSDRPLRQDPLVLLEGLLEPVQGLIGKQAGASLFRFAAVQEGRRIGRSHGRRGLAHVLSHLDVMLEQQTKIESASRHEVRLALRRATPLDVTTTAGGVVIGLLEGAVGEVHGEPFTGAIERGTSNNGTVHLLLRPTREVEATAATG